MVRLLPRAARLPGRRRRRRDEGGEGRTGRRHTRRILASTGIRESIVSLVGLAHCAVRNQSGQEIGRLEDLVARWADGQTYPPLTGLVVRIGNRLAFVDATAIDRMEHKQVLLSSARFDLRDFVRRPGEVMLAHDVLDHQLVDVDGVQVIRAADLYLAEVLGTIRLVGVDVSVSTLLRRLGPTRWRRRPTPDRVIDWAAIQSFGDEGQPADGEGPGAGAGNADGEGREGADGGDGAEGGAEAEARREVRLRTSRNRLHRLRPGELADLLEDLRRPERQRLLASLDADDAADALEEMEADDLAALLRDADPGSAAKLVARMEPDEAAEALRDLDEDDRRDLLSRMDAETAAPLLELLGYPEDRAGGFMTTTLVVAERGERIAEVTDRLARIREHEVDIDAVAIVDRAGRLIEDVRLLDVLLALRSDPDAKMGTLVTDEDPVSVTADANAAEVADVLLEARQLSVVVVEEEGRPIGRILADDLLDAVIPARGRVHFPKLLQ
jgi:CBS domain-containing protein